jgi:ribonuclease Z
MRRLVQLLVLIVFVGFAFGAAITRFEPLQDMVMKRFAANIVAKNQDALFADDALRAVVCGSASPMPDPKRASACIAVFAGGHFYVVDTGTNSWENFATWRVAPQKVGAIFYSHFHSDHITDLGEFNMQTWVAGRPGPLRVFGAPGVERLVGGFQEAYAQDRSYRTAHHGEEFVNPAKGMMEAKTFEMPAAGGPGTVILEENGLVVRAFAVDHAPIHPAVGYRFDYKGRSVVVSGDTVKSTSLVEASKDVDVLFHEAQANFAVEVARDANAAAGFLQYAKLLGDIPDYHTSPVEAAEVANAAGADLLVLYHLTPPPPNPIAERIFMRGVSDVRRDGVMLSRDGLLVTLPAGSDAIETSYLD